MNRKAFLIIFDENQSSVAQLNEFHDDLVKDPSVLAWWHHLTNTYIIITNEKPNVTKVRQFLLKRMPNTHHLVLEVKANNYDGWLPKTAWDWFESSFKKV